MTGFLLVKVHSGDAYQRGVQYGRQAEVLIKRGIENYKKHFASKGSSWDDISARSGRYIPLLERICPNELEEVRGIARGAAVSMNDVMALNCRYELLKDKPKECTSASVLEEATGNGKVYLAQNWDYRTWVMDCSVIVNIDDENGTKILGISEAGQLVRNGFNSHGVGICANNLTSTLDVGEPGIPVTFLRRKLLNSCSFAEASKIITGAERSVSCNYMLASAENIAADFEAAPGRVFRLLPERGIVTHANHFVVGKEFCTNHDHQFRDKVLRRLLLERYGKVDLEHIMNSLRSHETFPGASDTFPEADCIEAVCTHLPKGNPDFNSVWQTIASVIYDLKAGEAYICKGNPCCGEYHKYSL